MTIELPPAQTRTLNQLLKSGGFSSPEQVLAEGLRLLQTRQVDRETVRARIRQEILAGTKQVRAGRLVPFDDGLVADIKARGRARLANGKHPRRANHA